MGKDYADKKKVQLVKSNKSFIMETVIAKEEKFEFMKKCKDLDYKIIGFYVGVESPSICVQRTKKRHQEGEHDVPEEKIINRYFVCMDNFYRYSNLVDELYAIDNSDKPRLMMYKDQEDQYISDETAAWFTRYYLTKVTN